MDDKKLNDILKTDDPYAPNISSQQILQAGRSNPKPTVLPIKNDPTIIFLTVISIAAAILVILGIYGPNLKSIFQKTTNQQEQGRFAQSGNKDSKVSNEEFAAFQARYRLAGILSDEAIVEEVETEKQSILKKGGSIGGYTVAAVEKTRIILNDASGKEFIWSMSSGKGGIATPDTTTGTSDTIPNESDTAKPDTKVDTFVIEGIISEGRTPMSRIWVAAYASQAPQEEPEKEGITKIQIDSSGVNIAKGGKIIATSSTDASGYYRLEVDQEVAYLQMNARHGLQVREEGPWTSNATVDIKIEQLHFSLEGTITDDQGNPISGATVQAFDDQNKLIGHITNNARNVMSDSKGHYKFRVPNGTTVSVLKLGIKLAKVDTGNDNRPIYLISRPTTSIKKEGPWSTSTTVDIVVNKSAFFTLEGTVYGPNGKPAGGVRVQASGLARTVTDKKGHYKLQFSGDVEVPVVSIYFDERSNGVALTMSEKGPWTADATIDFDAAKNGFTLEVTVSSRSGALPGIVRVVAYGENDKYLAHGHIRSSEASGTISLEVTQKVTYIKLYLRPVITKEGPWTGDANVDITID